MGAQQGNTLGGGVPSVPQDSSPDPKDPNTSPYRISNRK